MSLFRKKPTDLLEVFANVNDDELREVLTVAKKTGEQTAEMLEKHPEVVNAAIAFIKQAFSRWGFALIVGDADARSAIVKDILEQLQASPHGPRLLAVVASIWGNLPGVDSTLFQRAASHLQSVPLSPEDTATPPVVSEETATRDDDHGPS